MNKLSESNKTPCAEHWTAAALILSTGSGVRDFVTGNLDGPALHVRLAASKRLFTEASVGSGLMFCRPMLDVNSCTWQQLGGRLSAKQAQKLVEGAQQGQGPSQTGRTCRPGWTAWGQRSWPNCSRPAVSAAQLRTKAAQTQRAGAAESQRTVAPRQPCGSPGRRC